MSIDTSTRTPDPASDERPRPCQSPPADRDALRAENARLTRALAESLAAARATGHAAPACDHASAGRWAARALMVAGMAAAGVAALWVVGGLAN